jgi:serine/threonine-protein kinase
MLARHMAPHDEIVATLSALGWAETEFGAVGETIGRRGTDGSLLPPASDALPRLSVGEDARSDLVLEGELGRGGMGVVRAARQRSIEREVAIKSTPTGESRLGRALVREGRIMGALEHPNVVPVHALGLSESDGTPLLVMKRVVGVSWRTFLRDAAHPAWRALLVGHGNRLRANVEILSQLCRALSYAHEHGVVHRDLKPDNVMIGTHGEVMLLDWGVALRLAEREHEPPRHRGNTRLHAARDGAWDAGAGRRAHRRLNRIAETLAHPRRGESVLRSGVGWGAPNRLRRGRVCISPAGRKGYT